MNTKDRKPVQTQLLEWFGTERISFECPPEIIDEALQKGCDQVGLMNRFVQDIPYNMAGGEGAYFEEIELLNKKFVGLRHIELSRGYGAAIWGNVIWIADSLT